MYRGQGHIGSRFDLDRVIYLLHCTTFTFKRNQNVKLEYPGTFCSPNIERQHEAFLNIKIIYFLKYICRIIILLSQTEQK